MKTDGFRTVRELDETLGVAKGTAFRCFKQQLAQLQENSDFHVLEAVRDKETIELLRRQGRIYPQSVNVVLLSPASAERLLECMRQQSG